MFSIAHLDYKNLLAKANSLGIKCVIFFLYSEQISNELSYELSLSEKFELINRQSGKEIVFITHYQYYPDEPQDENYLHYFQPLKREHINLPVEEIRRGAYNQMRNFAKTFCHGIDKKLPCFIIFSPNDPKDFVYKDATNVKDIFREVSHIITDIQGENYNIKEYSEKYSDTYYYLSSTELFIENLNALYKGVTYKNLVNVITQNNAKESFDLRKIEKLQKNGFIPIGDFFSNFYEIRIPGKEIPEGPFCDAVDRYLHSFYSSDISYFPVIENQIEQSSNDYLKSTYSIVHTNEIPNGVQHSLSAICLGKVIEDEMNLGFYSLLRHAFGIDVYNHYDEPQEHKDEVEVKYSYRQNDESRRGRICFNQYAPNNKSELIYPKISNTRRISFDSSCVCECKNQEVLLKKAREEVAKFAGESFDVYTQLHLISEMRNKAVHHAVCLTDKENQQVLDAFTQLIENRFFEINNKIKREYNQKRIVNGSYENGKG